VPRRVRLAALVCGPILAALLALLPPAAAAGVDVKADAQGQVSVSATAAPLSDILDALASHLGLEVEYEGTPPRQLVSLELAARTPAEAVLSTLEGQGLDFALQLDASGQRVRKLFVTTVSGSAPRRPPEAARPAPRRPPFRPPVPQVPDPEEEADEEDPFAEEEAGPVDDEEEAEPELQTLPGPQARPVTLPTPRPRR